MLAISVFIISGVERAVTAFHDFHVNVVTLLFKCGHLSEIWLVTPQSRDSTLLIRIYQFRDGNPYHSSYDSAEATASSVNASDEVFIIGQSWRVRNEVL